MTPLRLPGYRNLKVWRMAFELAAGTIRSGLTFLSPLRACGASFLLLPSS